MSKYNLPLEAEIERDVAERKATAERIAAIEAERDELKRVLETERAFYVETVSEVKRNAREAVAKTTAERDKLLLIIERARLDFDAINAKATIIAEDLERLKRMI
jgi:hypothetical protein